MKFNFLNRYQFSILAQPGDAIFEATLEINRKGISVIGKIIRSSRYGNQSHCVNDAYLKNFCFCRDTI